jgi:nucleoside diphosphate kinase
LAVLALIGAGIYQNKKPIWKAVKKADKRTFKPVRKAVAAWWKKVMKLCKRKKQKQVMTEEELAIHKRRKDRLKAQKKAAVAKKKKLDEAIARKQAKIAETQLLRDHVAQQKKDLGGGKDDMELQDVTSDDEGDSDDQSGDSDDEHSSGSDQNGNSDGSNSDNSDSDSEASSSDDDDDDDDDVSIVEDSNVSKTSPEKSKPSWMGLDNSPSPRSNHSSPSKVVPVDQATVKAMDSQLDQPQAQSTRHKDPENKGQTEETAFLFLKPHACNKSVVEHVTALLKKRGLRVLAQGKVSGAQMEKKYFVDRHFASLAKRAMITAPLKLSVTSVAANAFHEKFDEHWHDALASKRVVNAVEAGTRLKMTGEALGSAWKRACKEGRMARMGRGFSVALLYPEDASDTLQDVDLSTDLDDEGPKEPLYVVNGFYRVMRARYLVPSSAIHYLVCEWDTSLRRMPWAGMKAQVVGGADPSKAPEDSIRGSVYKNWQHLGLSEPPDELDNVVHASSSAFSSLVERTNWMSGMLFTDPLGSKLLLEGLPPNVVSDWTTNPVVRGRPVFDHMENLGFDGVVAKAKELHFQHAILHQQGMAISTKRAPPGFRTALGTPISPPKRRTEGGESRFLMLRREQERRAGKDSAMVVPMAAAAPSVVSPAAVKQAKGFFSRAPATPTLASTADASPTQQPAAPNSPGPTKPKPPPPKSPHPVPLSMRSPGGIRPAGISPPKGPRPASLAPASVSASWRAAKPSEDGEGEALALTIDTDAPSDTEREAETGDSGSYDIESPPPPKQARAASPEPPKETDEEREARERQVKQDRIKGIMDRQDVKAVLEGVVVALEMRDKEEKRQEATRAAEVRRQAREEEKRIRDEAEAAERLAVELEEIRKFEEAMEERHRLKEIKSAMDSMLLSVVHMAKEEEEKEKERQKLEARNREKERRRQIARDKREQEERKQAVAQVISALVELVDERAQAEAAAAAATAEAAEAATAIKAQEEAARAEEDDKRVRAEFRAQAAAMESMRPAARAKGPTGSGRGGSPSPREGLRPTGAHLALETQEQEQDLSVTALLTPSGTMELPDSPTTPGDMNTWRYVDSPDAFAGTTDTPERTRPTHALSPGGALSSPLMSSSLVSKVGVVAGMRPSDMFDLEPRVGPTSPTATAQPAPTAPKDLGVGPYSPMREGQAMTAQEYLSSPLDEGQAIEAQRYLGAGVDTLDEGQVITVQRKHKKKGKKKKSSVMAL